MRRVYPRVYLAALKVGHFPSLVGGTDAPRTLLPPAHVFPSSLLACDSPLSEPPPPEGFFCSRERVIHSGRKRGVGGCNEAILRGVFAYRRIGRLSLTDFYENTKRAAGTRVRARGNMPREHEA